MKIIGLFLVAAISTIGFSQEKINWIDYPTAIELQKKDPKPIIVDVYTEWCGWCKKMDATTFSDPQVVKYMNENYYCVKFDAESKDTIVVSGKQYVYYKTPEMRRGVNTLAVELLGGQMSYPSYVFVDAAGKKSVAKGWMDVAKWMAVLKQMNV